MKIVITGASRGIGFESAKLFAASGHQVLAVSRNSDKLSALAKCGITTFSFDLTSEDYTDLIEKVKGFGKIDVLINNAGALVNKPFSEISDADLQLIYNVNVFAPFRLVRDLYPYFSCKSHTINVSSVGGVQGSVKFPGLSAYSSSKGALITLTELLAEEYKNSGPSFNVLALGAVQTEMLDEVFPGYNAPNTAAEMASHIFQFSISGHKFYNGKLIQISKSTP